MNDLYNYITVWMRMIEEPRNLILADRASGMTTALIQYAHDEATQGRDVLFLTVRPRALQQRFPDKAKHPSLFLMSPRSELRGRAFSSYVIDMAESLNHHDMGSSIHPALMTQQKTTVTVGATGPVMGSSFAGQLLEYPGDFSVHDFRTDKRIFQ